MKFQVVAVALTLAASAAALPGMGSVRNDMLGYIKTETIKRESKAEPAPASIASILGSLEGTIEGLLGSLASSVDASDKRPQKGYTFKAPTATDSRGPCPGLNLLANYGYLPRNGYVSFGQVLNATAEGFNMGADLAAVLAIFAVLTTGNITTESWYIGTDPNTKIGGLNRHSTVEADVSPNREDYYTGCGDNHHLSSRLFTQNVNIVAASASKQFDLTNMGSQYAEIATFSKTYNPYIYYFPFPLIVSLGAFAFYPNFFSNGTYGAGGVANYESISSIVGAKYDSKKNQFEYVPERWPTNWYRRSTEYGAVATLEQGFLDIYTRNLIVPGFGQTFTANLNVSTIFCDIYQGFQSITPLILAGTEEEIDAAITWAQSKFTTYLGGTIAGCSTSTLSPNSFLFPNSSTQGGALNPPPSVTKNIGNNVYNKIYFETAPTKPACNHAYSA